MFMTTSIMTGGVVTISGEVGINHNPISQPAKSGIRINADGTIDERLGDSYSQIDAATDWIIPNGAANSSYEFTATDNNANLDAGSDATGTWASAPLEWWVEETVEFATENLSVTVGIRFNGGAEIDNGTFTGQASVNL